MTYTKKPQHTKNFSITFKSPTGNVVGHFNPSATFLKAVTGKQQEFVTVQDIMEINQGKLMEYLMTTTIEISNPNAETEIVDITNY